MDLDADGHLDILSGSYSRQDRDMAGLFQVLRGKPGRTWSPAEPLKGSDGKLLIVTPSPGEGDHDLDLICTRAFAADLDGDGCLDLVTGNFGGTFAWFRGGGKGLFDPKSAWLKAGGEPMEVEAHSDPFLVDWDRDGDLDLLSGSAGGGVFWFENTGTVLAPVFAKRRTWLAPLEERAGAPQLGDGHLAGPGECTRVWADDVNGDGKLDLLVGDNVTLYHAAEGVSDETALAKLAEFNQKVEKAAQARDESFAEEYEKLEKERERSVHEDRTGFVWVLHQK